MKQQITSDKKAPLIHPIMFGLFPILFLYSHNMQCIELAQIYRSVAVVVALTLSLWVIFSLILRSWKKGGIISSLLLIYLFSYGRLYQIGAEYDLANWGIGRHRYLLFLWLMPFVVGAVYATKSRKNLIYPTRILNAIAICLIIMPLLNIGASILKTSRASASTEDPFNYQSSKLFIKPKEPPNVYYIILDAYAREDVLQKTYNYDNSNFIDYLTNKGFYVANRSRSNYMFTDLSLASTLNMRYLDDFASKYGTETNNRRPLHQLLQDNRVFQIFKQMGYTNVDISSGVFMTDMQNVDIYLQDGFVMNEFEHELLDTTVFVCLERTFNLSISQYGRRRKAIRYSLEHLSDTAEMEGPVFVFSHIVCPHIPFIFGRNGEPVNPDDRGSLSGDLQARKESAMREYITHYREQLEFVTKKISTTIDEILTKSNQKPIIILQSDHGPSARSFASELNDAFYKERAGIINAYYFPDADYARLYDSITPVNSFRKIFNQYFGADFEQLGDETYFSGWQNCVYKFENVTAHLQ